ncbi:hypothetical protein PVK06_031343 [Gossypium arboreum]|uniref:RNase H type-1 domain-containing protein n=1 Tax=Gossypium arboreum TaxID=29729 RepID=A0ABR0NT57_GOSAR|nr:hypothetical protein PVK06_031343 [Gossypium arboreum]
MANMGFRKEYKAFDKRNYRSASSLVVRDQLGVLKGSKIILHENIPFRFVAEAHAGLDAIKLVIETGLTTTTIKGNSKTVVKNANRQKWTS